MTGIVSTTIGAAMMAAISIPLMQLNVQQAKGRANMEARLQLQSEIEYAKRAWTNKNKGFNQHKLFSSYCKKDQGYGYVKEGFNFKVSCEVGKEVVGGKDLLLSFSEDSTNQSNSSITESNNRPRTSSTNNKSTPSIGHFGFRSGSNTFHSRTSSPNQDLNNRTNPREPYQRNNNQSDNKSAWHSNSRNTFPRQNDNCYFGWKGSGFVNKACDLQ
ncbi:hypothetical protein MITS9509_03548 [Synechococcus sp. MIT S9509]|uniref:hypothetical protein n=1 Tax=Synechococcus sp. MIT S9509 TaxID=1801630 RepID=UPI0007BAFC31|nr:hypothetical protein [Synechococcus sp. MIT S9509]KZR85592.1 hypothetical protein MITS9509_03548 [Synechococcus sp. MIT S9509]